MDKAAFRFLLTPAGQRWLAELADTPLTPQNHLSVATRLRRDVTPEQAHALLETTLLRQEARGKFSRAGQMYFTRTALEQSSSETISSYRAQRFAAAGFDHLADLGCGIGGDALALAAHASVTGIDRNAVRLAMAQQNLEAYGRGAAFRPLRADLLALPPLPVEALFFDPGRRDEHGRRIYSVAAYHPPLSLYDRWRSLVPHAAIKISPGVHYDELPPEAEVEFISDGGEVKEAVLWYGALHSGVARRATLLPGEYSLTTADLPAEPTQLAEPGEYLYEPDGAVIRAHLVEALAAILGASKIDEDIAYLTANQQRETPFARCFRLRAALPFQLKQLRRWLRDRGIGGVTIKKRGSPLDVEDLRRRLQLRGADTAVLFLTHVRGEPFVLVGDEVTAGG